MRYHCLPIRMHSIKKLSKLSDVSWHLNKQTVVYPSNGTVLNNEREHPIVLNNLSESYINLPEFFENINFKQVTVALLPWEAVQLRQKDPCSTKEGRCVPR